jgi:tryptophanyl-tRNA synthetase
VDDQRREEMAATYRRGGFGYGAVKKELAAVSEAYFAEARQKRRELEADPDLVRQVLADGACRAREKAAQVLCRAQQACGVKQ